MDKKLFESYDLHRLCNILVVKIPKIKVCNPSFL